MRLRPFGTSTIISPRKMDDDDDDECALIGGISEQGKPKHSEKACPVPLCQRQISYDLTRARSWAAAVGCL
jgi:hypothetical protein